VLLPGLGLTWRSWLPVLDALEAHHEVAALDHAGLGAPPPVADGAPTPQRLAEAVADELDDLGWARPIVVGNSLGGWVALELARRGRAARVVAIAPTGLESPPERAYVSGLNELLRATARVTAPFGRLATWAPLNRTALLIGLHARPWRLSPQEAAAELASLSEAESFHSALALSQGPNVADGLRQIGVPVRVVAGTHDFLLGAYTSPRFRALLPDAEFVLLPGVGHVPMPDDPALVARTILEFTAPS
jgi:pimeloyl-ACP methyl ester carboxylesterase